MNWKKLEANLQICWPKTISYVSISVFVALILCNFFRGCNAKVSNLILIWGIVTENVPFTAHVSILAFISSLIVVSASKVPVHLFCSSVSFMFFLVSNVNNLLSSREDWGEICPHRVTTSALNFNFEYFREWKHPCTVTQMSPAALLCHK